MPTTPAVIDSGLVEPGLLWGSMAITAPSGGRGLAYLTLRPTGDRHELGVISHGTHGPTLAERMGREITHWNEHYRTREAPVDLYPRPVEPPKSQPGHFIVPRPSAHLVVTWTAPPHRRRPPFADPEPVSHGNRLVFPRNE